MFGLHKYDHVTEKTREHQWMKINEMFLYFPPCSVHRLIANGTPLYLCCKLEFSRNAHKRCSINFHGFIIIRIKNVSNGVSYFYNYILLLCIFFIKLNSYLYS